jgi:hypothetical protein
MANTTTGLKECMSFLLRLSAHRGEFNVATGPHLSID